MLRDKDTWRVVLFVGIFYLIGLGSYPLHTPDGGRYAEIAREMVTSGQYWIPHLNGLVYFEKPPLFYWMLALNYKFLGPSEWSMRLWDWLLMIVLSLATFRVTRHFYTRRAAFLSVGVLSTSLLTFAMTHVITLDFPLTVWVSLSLYSYLLGVHQQKRALVYAAYIFAGLAVMTKGLVGIVFPMMIIGVWILFHRKWRLLFDHTILIGLGLVALIALPWMLSMEQHFGDFFDFFVIKQHFSRYLTDYARRQMPFYEYMLILLVGFMPWTVFLPQAVKKYWGKMPAPDAFFLVWAVSIFIFYAPSDSLLISYLLPMMPAMAILMANFLDGVWDQSLGRSGRWSVICLISFWLVLAVVAPAIPHFRALTDPNAARWYLSILSFFAVVAAGSLMVCLVKRPVWSAVVQRMGIAMMGICLSILWVFPQLNNRSARALTDILQQESAHYPHAHVVLYEQYFQDVPYYLNRRVHVVGWLDELRYGLSKDPAGKHWMMGHDQFWPWWHRLKTKSSTEPVFLLMRKIAYDRWPQQEGKLCVVAQTVRLILASNQSNCGQTINIGEMK